MTHIASLALIALSGLLPAVARGAPPVVGADGLLEERVGRIERILENRGGTELMLFAQQLQQELQALRGQVELQGQELERLRRQIQEGGTAAPPPADTTDRAMQTQPAPPPRSPAGRLDLDDTTLAPPPDAGAPAADPLGPAPRGGGTGIPALPAPETAGGGGASERALYGAAFDRLKERDYDAAIRAFTVQLNKYPRGEFADTGRYWLGETYYSRRDLPAALAEFERLVADYPDSSRMPGALLRIGAILDEQQQSERARMALEMVIDRYPASTEARLARDRLERLGRPGR